ncbi:hypothetical protein FGRMN_9480 [Fusarium graminum]|nr:hypothetical protein FGRMN_9480 [Fusarium graminum]
MGREKRNLPAAVAGGPKERHKRAQRSQYDHTAPVPSGFVAKPAIPKTTKHHSYFEFVENKDKKKKLEFQITTKKTPPPGFEFVPAGNPQLTQACKELSREKDAMIFIVSVHRIGHHVREIIVEEARTSIGQARDYVSPVLRDAPEPIPESQDEYDAQVDAALRDLFPRIPNTDRQMIIEHAFRRDPAGNGEKEKVGLSEDITLARRVQLAVLAHIRHTHTRYDTLLKETSWQNARKVVETLCLDTLVKWRGDEESGRDQLDEILREVVVISDSDGDESDNESDSSIEEVVYQPANLNPSRLTQNTSIQGGPGHHQSPRLVLTAKAPVTPKSRGKVKKSKRKTSAEKKGQRGFKRYQAAWQNAIDRNRNVDDAVPQSSPIPPTPQYTQCPPPTNLAPTGDALPPASQLRLISGGAGPAPYENGSPARVNDRLQDMLVQSIEPASPSTMKPSFVRAIPPRGQGFGNEPTMSTSMQHPVISTTSRGIDTRGEPMQISWPAANEPKTFGDRPYQFSGPDPRRGAGISTALVDRHDTRLRGSPDVPLRRYNTRSHGSPDIPVRRHYNTRSSGMQNPARILVSRRPYDEVQRPGDRDTPIVMEDRGGFYERVPVRSAVNIPASTRDETAPEHWRPAPGPYRNPEGHQPLPWEDGPRLLQGSRSHAGTGVVPINQVSLEERQYPVLTEPRTVPYHASASSRAHNGVLGYSEPEPRVVRYNPPGSEPRPIMNEPIAPRYEPFREIRHDERVSGAFQQRGPMHRYYREELPVTEDRRRPPTLHPRRLEDVIVLE